MTQTESHNNLFVALQAEMLRVDALRLKLDLRKPNHVLPEFLMRRALTHAAQSMQMRDIDKAERFWKLLFQIGRGDGCPR